MSPLFEDPAMFRSLLEELPIGVCVVDRGQRIRLWNRGAEQITGHLAHEMLGRQETGDVLKPCDRQGRILCDELSPLIATLRNGESQQYSVFYLHKNGHRVAVRVRLRPILEHGDAVVGAISLFEEAFSFRDETLGPLMHGCLDAATGVPSPGLSRAVLQECTKGMEQSHTGFGILQVRILGLREFGARHGPQSIAPFLRTTAQTLLHNLGGEAFLGCWNEHQFIAILPSASPMVVEAAAERVRRLLRQSEVCWWGDHFRIEAEVVSAVARPGDHAESFLSEEGTAATTQESKASAEARHPG